MIAGALANGGVQTWQRERERQLQARVAARLLYGELIIVGQDVQRIAAMERWPDTNMANFARATEAWSVQSPAFAACATGSEWSPRTSGIVP